MKLRIELLGGLRVIRGEETVTRFPTRKTAALLAYFALFPRQHPREVLAELLWPEGDLQAGRKSLSVALSALRRVVEPEEADRGTVLKADHFSAGLEPSLFDTDVAEFERRLREAQEAVGDKRARVLGEALEGFRDPLLPGVYEDWVPREQERLNALARAAAAELAGLLKGRGEPERAIIYARRAVELDPLDEEGHRRLMALYAESGRVPDALRQYQELEDGLRRELDAEPSPATRALVEALRHARHAVLPRAVGESNGADAASPRHEHRHGGCPPAEPHAPLPPPRLPSTWTVFFDRESERSWLAETLGHQARLVTLTGPGGAGKSRLALEAAAGAEARGESAVWYVPLADVSDSRLLPEAIAGVLGLSPRPDGDLMQQVRQALRERPGLLVLDNVEHLLPEAARVVRSLLEGAPRVNCLVTSRQRLNVPGERELPVPPLTTPPETATLEQLLANESVQLFLDRAQAVRPDFRLTGTNAAAVGELCRRLEGVPLALELAAARVEVLTPQQILSQLEAGYGILADPHPGETARHASLEAAIEWSYRLLPDDLRTFFSRLAVFRGGWTLDATEAICRDGLQATALEALARLRQASLIQADEVRGTMRYRMLEMLRQYAWTRLPEAERRELQRAHRDFYLELANSQEIVPGALTRRERLVQELANLRAALEWCRTTPGEVEAGYRLGWALGPFWSGVGYLREGRDYLLGLLAADREAQPTRWRARALTSAGALDCSLGEHKSAEPLFQEALTITETTGERWIASYALFYQGVIASELGRHDLARSRFEESLRIKRETDDPWGVAAILASLGNLARLEGDFAAARAHYEESLRFSSAMGDRRCMARALDCLGLLAREEGHLDAARSYHDRALDIRRDLGEAAAVSASLANLALVDIREGRWDEAEERLMQSLRISREREDEGAAAKALAGLARVALGRGATARAAALYREALQLRAKLAQSREVAEMLEGLGHTLAASGAEVEAVRLLRAAEGMREEMGVRLSPDQQWEREAALQTARRALGEERFAGLWEQARRLTSEQAVAAALRATEPALAAAS